MKKNIAKISLILMLVAVLVCGAVALTACDDKGGSAVFETERVYKLDTTNINFMGQRELVPLVCSLLLDEEKTYFTFKTDGTVHGQISLKEGLFDSIGTLIDGLSGFMPDLTMDSINSMIANIDLAEGLEFYAEPMFPGFTAYLENGDANGALGLLKSSLGLSIGGIDFSQGALKEAVQTMGTNYKNTGELKLPANLLSIIPPQTQLSLNADWQYTIQHLKGEDGKSHDGIYIGGAVAHNPSQTQPFAIFTMGKNDEGKETLLLRIEFMNIDLALVME